MKKWEGEILKLGNLSKSFISLRHVPGFSPWSLETRGFSNTRTLEFSTCIHTSTSI